MAPSTSNLEQSVVYSDIKVPTDPNKVSQSIHINAAIVTIPSLSQAEAFYKRCIDTGSVRRLGNSSTTSS